MKSRLLYNESYKINCPIKTCRLRNGRSFRDLPNRTLHISTHVLLYKKQIERLNYERHYGKKHILFVLLPQLSRLCQYPFCRKTLFINLKGFIYPDCKASR